MRNLAKIFVNASDTDIRLGRGAWMHYHALLTRVAKDYGSNLEIVAAIFSALSPRNDYNGNLRDLTRVLNAFNNGLSLSDFKVSTFSSNKRKAWQIVCGKKPLDVLVAPKTRSFFLNILDPFDAYTVTVDGHIYNAWMGKRTSLGEVARSLKSSLYLEIADDIRLLAKIVKLLPCEVQGVIWYSWRRLQDIKYNPQLELWHPDARIVGLEVPFLEKIGANHV